ncbi:pantothenate kinase [Lentilactobacillus senioris DSM 24302 = JCM 17472]|uniref:Pantothenate kinase n=1 Tax=Lentilactobacillus senioris DSM 24302 = JCM 17472 TaxID=1423802 RepID=A0A0R2CNQ7_9LACO|nr:type I pantothenate kinase [Lentilactobacillus senioris]KRM93192.1 pantothenate kinase [Lentilactobacillus senioris DSM 24302 = JCM 17472]
MNDLINYYSFDKEEWKHFYEKKTVPLTASELRSIKAFNDKISLQDVSNIYIPLVHLLSLQLTNFNNWQETKANFLHKAARKVPFIIGISGSVAVGKSTTARLLEELLSYYFPENKVQLITTDGFLYPTAELKRQGIMDRKGFPESYDMAALINFLNNVKAGVYNVKVPVYSHQVYDIVPGEFDIIDQPDILIIEGINVLQLPSNEQIYVSDFTDFSIYVDADANQIREWYLERFGKLMDTAFQDPQNHYYKYAQGNRAEAFEIANNVWDTIDLPNLEENILPTRSRADMIMHKTKHHIIDKLYLRKY